MKMSWKEIRMKKIDYLGGGGRTYWPSYCPVNVREIMRSSRMEDRGQRGMRETLSRSIGSSCLLEESREEACPGKRGEFCFEHVKDGAM